MLYEVITHNGWYNRGIVLNRMLRYNQAIESYEMALAIQEKFPAAWYNKGNAFANMGRLRNNFV